MIKFSVNFYPNSLNHNLVVLLVVFLHRFAAEGNQESLKAFLNETEYDDEGVYSLNGWTSNGCHPNKNDPTVTSQSPHSEVESSVSCNKRGIDKSPVKLNSGLALYSILFLYAFSKKKSLICLKGHSHWGRYISPSFLPVVPLSPLKGFLS